MVGTTRKSDMIILNIEKHINLKNHQSVDGYLQVGEPGTVNTRHLSGCHFKNSSEHLLISQWNNFIFGVCAADTKHIIREFIERILTVKSI